MKLLQLLSIFCLILCHLTPAYGQYWCNSFANSRKSLEYVTKGGTVKDGTSCCFPFFYRGTLYNKCTNVGHTQEWCGVESYYDLRTKLWGNCQRVTTPKPPPYYDCSSHTSTRSYEFVTQGGTVPSGTPCCFPFVYQGDAHYECIAMDQKEKWCAVESVYNPQDKKWGNCMAVTTTAPPTPVPRKSYKCDGESRRSTQYFTHGGTVDQGTPCCFPFIYNNKRYDGCTYKNHVQSWCAVETVYNFWTKLWGNCQVYNTPAPSLSRNGEYSCNAFPNSKPSEVVFTRGGTAPNGSPCCFPFTYKYETYNDCTTIDHDQPWCSVVSIYYQSNRWGNCYKPAVPPAPGPPTSPYKCDGFSQLSQTIVTTGGTVPPGTPCCFPFIYNRVPYYSCITIAHTQPWCSVDSEYKPDSKNWGNCRTIPTPAPPPLPKRYNCRNPSATMRTTGGTVTEGSACCLPFSYKGSRYGTCTMTEHDKMWCAVEDEYDLKTNLWGNCVTVRPTPPPKTPAPPPSSKFDCGGFRSGQSQTFVTTGGTAPENTPCCFPFFYRGKFYHSCTKLNHDKMWCAVESVYLAKKLWGNCKTVPSNG